MPMKYDQVYLKELGTVPKSFYDGISNCRVNKLKQNKQKKTNLHRLRSKAS